jgi:4a-hydroxytetrahydrobiopterin dehydratase
MMAERLGAEHVLQDLEGWSATEDDRDAISKTYKFSDFKAAFAFMSACALKAEAMDHHPEWFNVYNTVRVTLTTHEANGVTSLDQDLAGFMDAFAYMLS